MKLKHHIFTALAVIGLMLSATAVARADAVTDWNKIAVQEEVVAARIYDGIHFRFADEAARKQGRHIAQWAHGHFFQPLN